MSNPFDGFIQKVFDITTNVMGYDATWTPSEEGSEQLTGRVHYREPNHEEMMNGVQFTPFIFVMEYKKGVFDGLQDSVRRGGVESVTINGATHYVRSIKKTADGQTFEAQLEKISA